MVDPLNAKQREEFEIRLIQEWRVEYAKALASKQFDPREFGRPGNRTVAMAAVQRIFKEVILVPGVLTALRSY